MRLLHAFTAALAVGHAAAITYVQVVGAIDGVTKKSRSLTVTVESVNFLNVIVTAPVLEPPIPSRENHGQLIFMAAYCNWICGHCRGRGEGRSYADRMPLRPQAPPSPLTTQGPPFPAAEAKVVVKALTTFVNVHKALLNVVIGKNGLISRAPGGVQGIRLALVALEKGVDVSSVKPRDVCCLRAYGGWRPQSFAFALIALIPTEKESATLQFGSLSATLTTTVKKYGG